MTLGHDQRNKRWCDSMTLQQNATNPRCGDSVGIELAEDVLVKDIRIISDTRTLAEPWNFDGAHTDAWMRLNPFISGACGSLTLHAECTYDEMRAQIFTMAPFCDVVASAEFLRPSWFSHVHQCPASFPLLFSGKLCEQKRWGKEAKICVEIIKEPLKHVTKHSRFLHVHLDKVVAGAAEEESKNSDADKAEAKEDQVVDDVWRMARRQTTGIIILVHF